MKPVVDVDLLKISDFRDWPVFEKIRADSKFVEAFEREFGQKLLLDREAVNPSREDTTVGSETDTEGESADVGPPSDETLH